MLGPKPRVSSETTVKVKSFYLFQERTRNVDSDISYENRQTENRTKLFVTFMSALKFQGTYKKEAEGGSQCTLVCVVVTVGVCVSRFPKPLSGGEVGVRRAGPRPGWVSQPGLRQQQAAVGVIPSLSPPRLLCPSEKKEKDKECVAVWPYGTHSAGEEGKGLKGSWGAWGGFPWIAEGTLATGL